MSTSNIFDIEDLKKELYDSHSNMELEDKMMSDSFVLICDDEIYEVQMEYFMDQSLEHRRKQIRNVKNVGQSCISGLGTSLYFGIVPGIVVGGLSYVIMPHIFCEWLFFNN